MKIDCIADTNFLIYVHEGNRVVEPFMIYNFGISFISEVELLGYPGITSKQEQQLSRMLNDCFIIEWNQKVRQMTIDLRRKYFVKLPDAIVAATALVYELPLVTADKGFSKISELDLILFEVR